MTREEKKEIEALPEKYRPVGAWGYFGYSILFALPIIGWIFLIVFAISGKNVNRRSYARSFFCGFILVAIVLVIVLIVGGASLGALLEYLESYMGSMG